MKVRINLEFEEEDLDAIVGPGLASVRIPNVSRPRKSIVSTPWFTGLRRSGICWRGRYGMP
jgi:hypothetical protein